ncbi:alanyl-tRNA editing protein [Roseovarius aestuariivivens]|uniref:alanyl-tRNA editing protein n=1 Tax=Roseovarius aestuariivivens TaxID=1888910 RepID=UPI00107FED6B|nr:alanyl-tRNA editing protein [Roseovarius aestuariivivens]
MTRPLYLEDAYRTEADAVVTGLTSEGALIVDASVFYPTGGGQPGDSGEIAWDSGRLAIATAVKTEDGQIALVPSEPATAPVPGTAITQRIDPARRLGHMRMHTALHLLSVVIPLPVSGGAVGAGKSRLDFNMAEPPEDKAALEAALNALVARDLPVTESWITDAELRANPGLVKTMSVAPPAGQGRVRLVRIGAGDDQVDLQPCGGTHVARTGEIGRLRLGKIEKKGRQNRRVYVHLET